MRSPEDFVTEVHRQAVNCPALHHAVFTIAKWPEMAKPYWRREVLRQLTHEAWVVDHPEFTYDHRTRGDTVFVATFKRSTSW